MKTAIYLVLTCFISTGAFMAELNMKNPLPAFLIAFGVWAWFGWGCSRRARKSSQKKFREQMFQHHMRHHFSGRENR